MHLLLGLCLLFIIVNVDISSSGSTKCLYPQVSSLIFLPSARLILFFTFLFLFFSFTMILSLSQLCTLIPLADSFSISIGR